MSPALNWPLGHYRITREIDRGQFGTVYEARDTTRDLTVALKLIVLDGPDSSEKVEAERQGAILQQRFCRTHAGLVPEVFDHHQIDPYYAVAMELVRGESLSALIARGPLAPRRAATIAHAVAVFLDKAHQFHSEFDGVPETIVHGDLKPAHVLLLPDDAIRVLDFGIAKALAVRKTATTNKWGSVDYASPERLESGRVNEHADFWSLGVILFEMAAGFRPYRAHEGSPSRLESAIRRQEPRAALPAALDPALAAIIHKLLSPQPERRYQSARAIVRDLRGYIDGTPTVAAAELAHASQETVRITPADSRVGEMARPATSIPTEPLPASGPAPLAAEPVGAAPLLPPPLLPPPLSPLRPALAEPPPGGTRSNTLTRLRLPHSARARLLAIVVVMWVVAMEGLGIVRAERLRAEAPTLEVSDIDAVRDEYKRVVRWTPLGLGAWRVRSALRDRMIELTDRTILEFRAEAPALARAQWEQALACLILARELRPRDPVVSAKHAYVQGRLAWIKGRSRADVDQSIRLMRDAARLDRSSPDPYLGLAVVYAYSTRDLPALRAAIHEAEARGYTAGRRERAELGDLHKFLADRAHNAAQRLAGEARLEQLREAREDYAHCVEQFDDLRLGDSERSLAACRTRLRTIDAELQLPLELPPPSAALEGQP